jgi:SAM-dependent methyltransferase
VSELRSDTVKKTLSTRDVSNMWEAAYRTPENERFYERVFDYLLDLIQPPSDSIVLDVGCGPGFHSMRLARRGYRVHGVDFSQPVLALAQENVRRANLEEKVTFGPEDVTGLSIADDSYDLILCWGLLMHVPNVERAVDELARVLAPGGTLIVSERNLESLQARGLRTLRWLARRRGSVSRLPAGIEKWNETSAGPLLTRTADIPWLMETFRDRGVELRARLPGQFSEVYTKVRNRKLVALIQSINALWFARRWDPRLASGNILVLQKPVLTGSDN